MNCVFSQEECEQGRIQGALYSLSSLASAVGPMLLRWVYHVTKDNTVYGKGTMFIFGAGLYVVATICAYLLPEDKANSNYQGGLSKRPNYHRGESKNPSNLIGYGAVDL